MTAPSYPRRAIVLGASIAGLWTARVLADHFAEVLLIDRDYLPEGPELRPGTPQARQYHILLLAGLQLLRELFPGVEEELIAAGAVPFDLTKDVKVRVRGQWLRQFPSDQRLLSCSRLLIEAALRRRLRQNPCIRFVEGAEVQGLIAGPGASAVTGVTIQSRAAEGEAAGATEQLSGDLVVDALGRRSLTPQWLGRWATPRPKKRQSTHSSAMSRGVIAGPHTLTPAGA